MAYLDTNVFSNVPPRADSGQELIQIIVVVTALYDIFFEAVSLPLLRSCLLYTSDAADEV